MSAAALEPLVDESTQIPPTMGERLRRYVGFENRRRELEAELKDLEGRASALAATLLDDFADNGIQNTKCDGLTVYVRTDRFVSKRKDVETQQVCNVLSSIGREDMIADGYNAQSLKSYVLECLGRRAELQRDIDGLKASGKPTEAVEEQLAEVDQIRPLLDLLNVGEVPRIVTTK